MQRCTNLIVCRLGTFASQPPSTFAPQLAGLKPPIVRNFTHSLKVTYTVRSFCLFTIENTGITSPNKVNTLDFERFGEYSFRHCEDFRPRNIYFSKSVG